MMRTPGLAVLASGVESADVQQAGLPRRQPERHVARHGLDRLAGSELRPTCAGQCKSLVVRAWHDAGAAVRLVLIGQREEKLDGDRQRRVIGEPNVAAVVVCVAASQPRVGRHTVAHSRHPV